MTNYHSDTNPVLDDLRDRLGIHDRVLIMTVPHMELVCANATDATLGVYKTWELGHHLIFVRQDLDVVKAAFTVIHEMTHALQAERHGSFAGFMGEYRKQLIEGSCSSVHRTLITNDEYHRRYNNIPYEVEANEVAFACLADPECKLPGFTGDEGFSGALW